MINANPLFDNEFLNNLFNNKFEFIPEFPGVTTMAGSNKKTEFDLLVVDKLTQEKTLIEFKYNEFNCYLVAIYDPSRISVVTKEKLANKQSVVINAILKNNDFNLLIAIPQNTIINIIY